MEMLVAVGEMLDSLGFIIGEILDSLGFIIGEILDSLGPFIFVITAFVASILIVVILLMLLTPLFIEHLKNKPDGKDPSGFHLFTDLEEGQTKLIVRGDRLVRAMVSLSGHHFAREGSRSSEDYWEIKKGGLEEDPIADIIWFLRPWARYVYAITGAVFTGIYPFQRVREYPLERTKMKRHESESDITDKSNKTVNEATTSGGSNITLMVEEDISDHYRVREFLYPVRVAQADTQDSISVNLVFVVRAKVTNPHKAAFGIDRWENKLVNLATDAATNYTRSNTLDNVLTAKDGKTSGLKDAIAAIGQDVVSGFDIIGVDVIDISPNLDSEERKRLYAEALAKPVARATEIDGDARAAVLKKINEANKAGGDLALETLRTEANVRMAKEAKGGATIFMGTTGGDQSTAAILAELQKLNKHLGESKT